LIGAPTVESTFFEPQWRGFVRVSENPWVQDHPVQNTIIYPAAGMVVMVLEGARQIQDEGHRVEGYEISNMSINKAMIIPTSAHGLETKLNMKRHGSERSTDHREVEMFDFTIYSKILDAAWQKNCSGMLTIKYKPIVEASEVDNIPLDMKQYRQNYLSHKETCTETIPARQLYEALETIGMKYGSTFQNIKSVHKKDNISCTTVRIPDTKSRMPGKYEYPHLIHPATLDAIFQTVFVAGNEPMVPSHLLSLFISADFPEGAGQELGGYTNALRKGLRDATGNIVMFNGSWDEPKLIVKDLHFTALSTASDDAAERGFLPNHHNLCAELAWKEDVTTASPRLLSGWLELASYQNPAMNILDTCCENMYSMFSRLKGLGGRNETNPQFSKYTFTDTSDESFERCRDLLEDWPDYVDFKVLNRTTDLLEQGFKARSFDLVFADTPDVKFCNALRGLLKPRGNFVLISIAPGSENHVNRNEHAEEESDMRYERKALVDHSKPDTPFFDTEASKPDLILKDDFGRGYIEVFASDSKAKQSLRPSSREVLILVPANPSRKLHGLSVRLTEALLLAGAKVSCSQLTNPAICFSAKICLALLEVDSPLVSTWTDDEFQAFRSMISEINGCLWITSGGQMNSKSPFGAPITALFRTIRSEDPLKAIVTLDLDAETDLGSDLTGRVILSTFLKSFDSQSPSDEREYAERDGRIFIPRAMLEEQLSSRIEQDGKSHAPILEPFFQAERPLQLEVGTLGKLDSLHFITDHGALLPLGPREVEIRTHAVGVSQLDVATALGQTAQATIGSDVAGIVTRVGADLSMFKTGDRVITIVPGAFKTFVRNHQSAVQRIGDEMSFQHASSLPTNYITALYAIVTIGRLQEGESILIHGGADKFVHAAVQIAKNAGAEIFITTTSSEERSILLETYGLADDRVFDNRFNVFRRSSQESVFDLILNSFRGHLRIQALDCVQECM
jgi:acyl transferase domain-containing protein